MISEYFKNLPTDKLLDAIDATALEFKRTLVTLEDILEMFPANQQAGAEWIALLLKQGLLIQKADPQNGQVCFQTMRSLLEKTTPENERVIVNQLEALGIVHDGKINEGKLHLMSLLKPFRVDSFSNGKPGDLQGTLYQFWVVPLMCKLGLLDVMAKDTEEGWIFIYSPANNSASV